MSRESSMDGPRLQSRDFATDPPAALPDFDAVDTTSHRVRYDPQIDTNIAEAAPTQNATTTPRKSLARAETGAPFSPINRRRTTRVGTFRTVDKFEDFELRPGWHPGSEPGVDPTKPDGGHASMPTLSAPCDITIVDFSEGKLSIQTKDNTSLGSFLEIPQPKWAKCRWISVNGLSWDVIQLLGRHKNLHKLAVEDIMNTRSRTKAEWYPTHAFIVLTLQRLDDTFRDSDDESSESDEADDSTSQASSRSIFSGKTGKYSRKLLRRLKRAFRTSSRLSSDATLEGGKEWSQDGSEPYPKPPDGPTRTLRRYHASPDDPIARFMDKNSALISRNYTVACEQVSIFITNDNTVISFFEESAEVIEAPILQRLQTSDTIIRHSCDASMVGHAILDGIVDLAIPVVSCYRDTINDIEPEVLTQPNISHTKQLYILISEINALIDFIKPITTLIQALRDHKTDMTLDKAMAKILDPDHDPIITTLTYTYLGDVLDHCVLITDTLKRLKSSADGMIDLIFNTISAYQNESMKQLTTATIIFLPLTFITGYFGQNFEPFTVLEQDIGYFWKIAVPVVLATILLLQWEVIVGYCKAVFQRRYLWELKRRRLSRRDKKRA
ncbi:putative transporter [Triangularia verruculosa]|uniref:Transporter n=1 Tax=Triangularia verruculosa TaxID=2587418 RepID=A0AAN7AV44_9PEZI|nr:putative transporter [Triangularia verruculosa]